MNAPARSLAAPSAAQWALELPRAAWALASLWPARAMLEAAPRGDGRPVMLLPGLVNGDRSMIIMRRYLERLGYRATGWQLGRNFGTRAVGPDGERLLERIAEIRAETGETVTLIGVSLGGIMARFAAHRRPDLVREVITVAAPYNGDPHATNVWRAFEWFTGDRLEDELTVARREEIARPLPVPATAIWSPSDGLVCGDLCHSDDEPGLRSIAVDASHAGVQVHPEVLRAVADVLGGARPE